MRFVLFLFFALLTFTLHAEKYPILLEASVEIPASTNGGTVINITTNVYTLIQTNNFVTNITFVTSNYFTTNFYITNITVVAGTAPIVTLQNNVIDGKLGSRLQRNFLVSPTFSFINFGPDSFATVYLRNPNRVLMNFPTNVQWLGPMPTNQARCAILVEAISGEIWLTP